MFGQYRRVLFFYGFKDEICFLCVGNIKGLRCGRFVIFVFDYILGRFIRLLLLLV